MGRIKSAIVLCLAGRLVACSDGAGASVGTAYETVTTSPLTARDPSATPACPAVMPSQGDVCPCAFSCEYGDQYDVRCDTLMTGSHGQWTVTQRPDDAGCIEPNGAGPGANCPSDRPRIGTPCKRASEACDYDACNGGVNLLCTGGAWEDSPIECGA